MPVSPGQTATTSTIPATPDLSIFQLEAGFPALSRSLLNFCVASCAPHSQDDQRPETLASTALAELKVYSRQEIAAALDVLRRENFLTADEFRHVSTQLARSLPLHSGDAKAHRKDVLLREIPERGVPESEIWNQLDAMAAANRCQVGSGLAFGRPITGTHPLAASIVERLSTGLKPNLPIGFGYSGVWDVMEAAGDMMLKLFSHPNPEDGGMVVLKSATQSLQQALHLYLAKYYQGFGVDLAQVGLAGVPLDIPRPVILAPITANILLSKAAPLIGLGADSIYYLGLDEKYGANRESMIEALNFIHAQGCRVFAHVTVAGDAEHGIAYPAVALDREVTACCAAHGYRPPVIVDAAAQWLNLAMSGMSKTWDFGAADANIRAIIIDPQKIELPYDQSFLLLRDVRDLAAIAPPTLPQHADRRALLTHANNILSRGGEPALATYYYLLNQGQEGLRASRERILNQARRFGEYIASSSRYELISEPESSIVCWRSTSNDPEANWRIALALNSQEKDRLFVTYSTTLRARTPEELRKGQTGSREHDGLLVHMMEHNTPEAVDHLIRRLEELA